MQQPLMIEKEKDNDDAKPILKKLMKSIFYNGVTSQQSILSYLCQKENWEYMYSSLAGLI
jgi:hypothetical protein